MNAEAFRAALESAQSADDFIAGSPVDFTAVAGQRLRAQFRRQPLEHLRITTPDGRRVADPITNEATARAWFHNLGRPLS